MIVCIGRSSTREAELGGEVMGKFLGLICSPVIIVLLLLAALAEPTIGGEISWIWWVVGSLGGFSLFGWGLSKAR
jgi:hypothetical protein